MNKNKKLWLGAGIVAVGAYLLFKSKKAATPALAPSAPANLVGFDTGKFYDVKGGHAGVKGQGIFNNVSGMKKSLVDEMPAKDSGLVNFANQPFNFAGAGVVGEKKIAFADAMGDRKVAAEGKFFRPKTNKFDDKGEIFRKKAPVEPNLPVKLLKQQKPVNNFVSAEGAGMINSFKVQGGF